MKSDIREKIILAPMVRGSELAFRNLIRRQGRIQTACYSPMLRADLVVQAFEVWYDAPQDKDMQSILSQIKHEDGCLLLQDVMVDSEPLVVQLCGHQPDILHRACTILLQLNRPPHQCQIVGIDLNLGCPQNCASLGNYGAFLADNDPDLAVHCVAAMRRAFDNTQQQMTKEDPTSLPMLTHGKPQLSCKIRLRDTVDDTVQFAKALQNAGCDLLSVHCRRREVKHEGLPDYDAGAALVAQLHTPIIINGNVTKLDEARNVLTKTRAHAIMVARGFLRNPMMLVSDEPSPAESMLAAASSTHPLFMAAAYLDHCELNPPPSPLYISKHLRWIFRDELQPKNKYDSESYKDWKVRLWTFLVRPYLETIYQFRQILVLYAGETFKKDPSIELPSSLNGVPVATFHDIRYKVMSYNEDEALEEAGGFALGLFD